MSRTLKEQVKNKLGLETFLKSRLPRVRMTDGLPLVERAEITLAEPAGAKVMVYVAGYYMDKKNLGVIHGDNLQSGKVYQTGVTVIDNTPLRQIKGYRPLPDS